MLVVQLASGRRRRASASIPSRRCSTRRPATPPPTTSTARWICARAEDLPALQAPAGPPRHVRSVVALDRSGARDRGRLRPPGTRRGDRRHHPRHRRQRRRRSPAARCLRSPTTRCTPSSADIWRTTPRLARRTWNASRTPSPARGSGRRGRCSAPGRTRPRPRHRRRDRRLPLDVVRLARSVRRPASTRSWPTAGPARSGVADGSVLGLARRHGRRARRQAIMQGARSQLRRVPRALSPARRQPADHVPPRPRDHRVVRPARVRRGVGRRAPLGGVGEHPRPGDVPGRRRPAHATDPPRLGRRQPAVPPPDDGRRPVRAARLPDQRPGDARRRPGRARSPTP